MQPCSFDDIADDLRPHPTVPYLVDLLISRRIERATWWRTLDQDVGRHLYPRALRWVNPRNPQERYWLYLPDCQPGDQLGSHVAIRSPLLHTVENGGVVSVGIEDSLAGLFHRLQQDGCLPTIRSQVDTFLKGAVPHAIAFDLRLICRTMEERGWWINPHIAMPPRLHGQPPRFDGILSFHTPTRSVTLVWNRGIRTLRLQQLGEGQGHYNILPDRTWLSRVESAIQPFQDMVL